MAETTVRLRIEGMTCDGCAQTIRQGLQRVKGVTSAEIDWRAGVGEVTFDPRLTSEELILEAPVFRHGYQARVDDGCCDDSCCA